MDPIVLRAKLKRNLPLIFSLLFLIVGMGVGLFLIGQTQIFKKQAAGICPVEGAVCQWDYPQDSIGSTTFNYQIVDLTTGETVKSGTTQTTRVTFTPLVDHQYSCKVTPQTLCGLGAEKVTLNTCRAEPLPTATPTSPLTPTPTVTGEPTPTTTPALPLTPTETPIPTATGTPGPSPTSTVIPTSTPGNAGTGTPTLTPISTVEPTATATPTPTIIAGAPISPTPLAENLPESAAIGPTFYLLIFGILLVVSGTRLLL